MDQLSMAYRLLQHAYRFVPFIIELCQAPTAVHHVCWNDRRKLNHETAARQTIFRKSSMSLLAKRQGTLAYRQGIGRASREAWGA